MIRSVGRAPALGVDLVSVRRVAALIERSPRFLERSFTERERRHCAGHPERWAARWAAKEAVRKLAGGSGTALPAFRDVEVLTGADGSPRGRVRGWAAPVGLSLSHEGDWAVAVAMTAPGGALEAPLLSPPLGLRLADRPDDAHKGSFGTVVVLGGAPGFGGAPYLAAMGAARGGAGLVRAAVPAAIHGQVAARCVEVMVHALPDAAGGALAAAAADELLRLTADAEVLVAGPGLTTAAGPADAVTAVLDRLTCPAVVDADALNIAARRGYDWRRCPRPVVLTPHPAEMGRLTGLPVAAVQRDREGLAARHAVEHGIVVVLKGSRTIVAAPDGRHHMAPGAVVALATGGTGDVLAGLIGAMIAQGLEPFDAAVAGVSIHAEAGAAVQARRGRAGGLAGDLLEELPAAQERLRRALERGGEPPAIGRGR